MASINSEFMILVSRFLKILNIKGFVGIYTNLLNQLNCLNCKVFDENF